MLFVREAKTNQDQAVGIINQHHQRPS